MKQFDPNNINGVIPAMITSFNKDESINKEGIRKTVNYLIAEKVDGLYVTGSTGETFLMSQEEKKQAIEVIVEEVNGRVPVIAHIGSIGTKITTELGIHAEKVGVDALSALPPFYYGFTNEEIFNYYSDISNSTNLPIIFDSGIEGGLDILRALSLGANFVMLGGAWHYSLGALGHRGPDHLIDILTKDLNANMAQLGIKELKNINKNN